MFYIKVLELFLILTQVINIEAVFTISELSSLIRAKKLLLRKMPLILREGEEEEENIREPLPYNYFARRQRRTNSELVGENPIENIFDSKSLTTILGLKQKIISNKAVLVRKLIDETILTMKLLLRIFTTPITKNLDSNERRQIRRRSDNFRNIADDDENS
jgi:hypothetical protein